MTRTQVWSDGGGTQSNAIAALIIQGRLPKPDFSVIADTERERSSVWEYMERVTVPALRAIGIEITRIPKSDFSREDIWLKEDDNGRQATAIPLFVATEGTGKLRNICSGRWKRRVIQRWLRKQGVKSCDAWLGMTRDETQRVRASGEGWYQHRFPLIFDVPMRRDECVRLVTEEMKWPEPPRSACWMCPNRSDRDWRDMKLNWPTDFAKAVALERELQLKRPDFFLHRSLKPLDQVDFSVSQLSLYGQTCDSGYCFA